MHRPDWYWNIFKVFLLIYVLQEPAGSPQWNRQTSVIYLPIKTRCFRNSIFSYLMSICVSSVYVCHVNRLYTQLQKQQCTCFSTFELKIIIWFTYWQTEMIYSNMENFCSRWLIHNMLLLIWYVIAFYNIGNINIKFICLTPGGQNNSS